MLRRNSTNLKNHIRTWCLLLFKIGITIKEMEEWNALPKTVFPSPQTGIFSGLCKVQQLPLTPFTFTGESTLLTVSVDFASWIQIHAQCDLSHTICLAVFHTAMKIKCGAFYLKLLKKNLERQGKSTDVPIL